MQGKIEIQRKKYTTENKNWKEKIEKIQVRSPNKKNQCPENLNENLPKNSVQKMTEIKKKIQYRPPAVPATADWDPWATT